MSGATGVVQEGRSFLLPSISTRHTLQAPTDSRAGWSHNVGIWISLACAACRMVISRMAEILFPLIVSSIFSMPVITSFLTVRNGLYGTGFLAAAALDADVLVNYVGLFDLS